MNSKVIQAADFHTLWYRQRELEFRLYSRKQWEFCAIAQAARDELRPLLGARVLGFGVGREALPAWFAARGAWVTATDRPDSVKQWADTGQYATNLTDLHQPTILPLHEFKQRVSFFPADMNNIPANLRAGRFDLIWSCGSLEHLGSLNHGLDFICSSMACLKPGGVAVHTTEYNPDNDAPTLESPDLSLYRRRDLEHLAGRLLAQGDQLEPIDFSLGTTRIDHFVDQHPYGNYHLKINIGGRWTTTSILLIAKRGHAAP